MDVWLERAEYGRLFHDTVFDFFTERADPDAPFDVVRDRALLKVAGRNLARMRGEIPPPSEVAFRQQRDAFLADLDVFVKGEAKSAATATPRFFEVPFGRSHAERREGPRVRHAARDGRARRHLLLEGKIDRIDSEGAGAWAVWDYKTGSERQFKERHAAEPGAPDPARALRARRRDSPSAVGLLHVAPLGLLLPDAQGRRASRRAGSRGRGRRRHADGSLRPSRGGRVPALDAEAGLRVLRLPMACGDPDLAARRSKAKCDSGEPLLEALRALEGRDV